MNNVERLTSEIHKAIAALKGQLFENRSDYLQTIREAVQGLPESRHMEDQVLDAFVCDVVAVSERA
jgi:hypothetical protein